VLVEREPEFAAWRCPVGISAYPNWVASSSRVVGDDAATQ
jgi:hypothetical protein